MSLIKITELTAQLDLSSRTLRYYEQMGLIESVRPAHEKYRYYDEKAVERLHQILVLRKMQISIKDIIKIYGSPHMSTLVDVFVEKINEIDRETTALSELKQIINTFLQKMISGGVTKISALPLLYEEMDKQLELLEGKDSVNYETLSSINKQLSKSPEPSVIRLASRRVLSSCLKENPEISDPYGFWSFVRRRELPEGEPGCHCRFEFQTSAGDVHIINIQDDFINDSPYLDYVFDGGLFACDNVYLDDDLGDFFKALIEYFDSSGSYEVDYTHSGQLRCPAMLETLMSPDERRELVSLLIPLKKRIAAPEFFGQAREIGSITAPELEKLNPILWTKTAALDKLTPINSPHYRVTDEGEAEYISWISTRVLSTNISVKIPFRVDIEFRIGEESGGYGHGQKETGIRFHHGEDLNRLFGINMGNNPDERLSQESICFHQPLFGNYFSFPGRGKINSGEYNRLTWIVGLKHFAVIINGEVRYCGTDFPYMWADLSLKNALPIILGSDSSIKKYYRLVQVSQLALIPKTKIKDGALTVVTRQSNNIIPNVHKLITSEWGENYWFNGCARYLMEAAGEFEDEPDFGYWFFAGLTGDVLAQVYSFNEYRGESVSACMAGKEGGAYFEDIFKRVGYDCSFITAEQLTANKQMYLQTLIAYIDSGKPVMAYTNGGPPWGVYVGYEEHGKTLLYITGDETEPRRVPTHKIIGASKEEDLAKGWLFLGEKQKAVDLKELYRKAVLDIPCLFEEKTQDFCFGAEAFHTWARDIKNGRMDNITPDEWDGWAYHVSNICNMATNGSCADTFLKRALELNPDLSFIDELITLYKRTGQIWNDDGGKDLESLGGGFNVTLQNLQNKESREKIAAKIEEAAQCMDKVLEIIKAAVNQI